MAPMALSAFGIARPMCGCAIVACPQGHQRQTQPLSLIFQFDLLRLKYLDYTVYITTCQCTESVELPSGILMDLAVALMHTKMGNSNNCICLAGLAGEQRRYSSAPTVAVAML